MSSGNLEIIHQEEELINCSFVSESYLALGFYDGQFKLMDINSKEVIYEELFDGEIKSI